MIGKVRKLEKICNVYAKYMQHVYAIYMQFGKLIRENKRFGMQCILYNLLTLERYIYLHIHLAF